MYDNAAIDKIVELGGREWVSKDFCKHRIYVGNNVIYNAIDFRLAHYDHNGHYVGATLKGKEIGTSFAEHLKLIISHMELYYDLKTGSYEINDTYRNTNRFRWIFNETIEYINSNVN